MKRKRKGKETETAAPISSSTDRRLGKGYDVFLSFRGLDTRLTIADSLYHAMHHAGIHVFKDDKKLQVGEEIGHSLLQAINASRIYIPIFSKNYASSKWCLREIAHIVKLSRDDDEKVILPIFCDVDADDVKFKTSLYRKALQKHKMESGKDLAKQWEEALIEVARIKGWNLKDHGLHELINLTVKEVSSLLWTSWTNIPDHLVGMKDPMDEIMKRLDLGAFDVQFMVIHGMGGIGKTTLAEAIFKQISPQFQGHCCFLKDVRTHDIINLQKKLLSDILNLNCIKLSSIDEGANVIKMRFRGKKVLVVLDDIDKWDQIMRLAGEPNWFGGGSRIIITTRNIEFLVKEAKDDNVPATNNEHFSFYDMPEMNWDDALQLFCKRALGCAKPPPDYMYISEELINALGRLPLALDVVGSTLYGKCQSTWENVLYKLKKVMNEDVKKKLMISYEALDPNQQQIYLDIACFFINQEKTIAIKYWDAVFGYPTEIEVKTLTRMSLIKIMDCDKLWMHDQLRDLGRDIVHPENCNMRLRGSRLCSPKDAFHVVQRKKGTKNIVALNLGTPEPDATYIFKHKEFARLVNLRFLQLDGGNFEGDFKDLFSELRWLSWSNCSREFRATNFGLENLAILELSGDYLSEDWGGWGQIMVAKHLKVLKLVDCPSLTKTPEFSSISRLERLILSNCIGLWNIDKSIGNLQHLDYLRIDCGANGLPPTLSMLPCSIGKLVKLKHLFLKCPNLQKLPESIGQLESLLELQVEFAKIKELPYSIGKLKRLKVLTIDLCKLEKLPDSIGGLQSLLKLDLTCTKIKSLPDSIGNLKKLKEVQLSGTLISELPKTIGMVENLEEFTAIDCQIGEIPSGIGALLSLRFLHLSSNRFSRLPTTINQLTNLQELTLDGCDWIQQLPKLPESLTLLRFSLKLMTTIPNLSNLTNLVTLGIISFEGSLVQEPNIEWIVRLRALREFDLIVEGMPLPATDLSSLSQLQKLAITCVEPRSLTGLPSSIQELNLRDVMSPINWSMFSNLGNLSTLILVGYWLEEIQFNVLGKLRNLNRLRMCCCPLLKTLPGLSCLKEIRRLEVDGLPQLPEILDLGELKSLQELSIHNCNSIKRLTETSQSNLQNLKYLSFINCRSLESVPNVPYTKTSCHLWISNCQRLPDFCGPYRFYREG